MFVYKVIGLFRKTFYLQVENTCIILLIEENYAHKTSITLPLVIEVPDQDSKVFSESILPLFPRFFGWILEIFRKCGIFVFLFYYP